MITRDEAAYRAYQIIGFPAGHPRDGWELQEFSHGWIARWHGLVPSVLDLLAGRDGLSPDPAELCMAVERDAGLARCFTGTAPEQVRAGYDAVRHAGFPDLLREEPPGGGWGEPDDDG